MRSTNRKRKVCGIAAGVLLGSSLCQGSWADAPEIASASWAPGGVTFVTQVESALLLTVTGPGFEYQTQGRGILSFRPVDEDGQPLVDGSYYYELREIVTSPEIEEWEGEPDRRKRATMRRQLMREGRWPARPRTQVDVFRIEAGEIVAPAERTHSEADDLQDAQGTHDHPHPDGR